MSDSLVVPDLDGIPVDDEAEPLNANVRHLATAEEVDDIEEKA